MARTASNGKKIGTPGQRQLRVGELIRHELANILSRGDIREPELEGVIVTVPEVRVTPDLKLATCFVMPLGGRNAEAVVEALDRHRKYLRGEIARRINMKFAADLRFRVDTSFAEAARIDSLLRSDPVIRRDVDDAAPSSDEGGDD